MSSRNFKTRILDLSNSASLRSLPGFHHPHLGVLGWLGAPKNYLQAFRTMQQFPILFLDIDGVLNHSRACASSAKNGSLDPENVAQFNHIIQATAAKIVISSDWRWFYPYEQLCQLLREAGVAGEFLGATSTLWLEQSTHAWMSRGAEIEDWLATYGYRENFVILDDCDDIAPYLDRWVRTDPHKGLTEIEVQQAIAMLGVRPPI